MTSRDRAVIEAEITVLRSQARALPADSKLREQVIRTLDRRLEEWSECPSSGN